MLSGSPKIDRLLLAIAEFEGWYPEDKNSPAGGSRSFRNHNPGNLRSSPFMVKQIDGFAVFCSDLMGYMALHWDIMQKARGNTVTGLNGESTIYDLMHVYAPPSDNNHTEKYIAHIEEKTDFSRDTRLKEIFGY